VPCSESVNSLLLQKSAWMKCEKSTINMPFRNSSWKRVIFQPVLKFRATMVSVASLRSSLTKNSNIMHYNIMAATIET